MSSKAGEAGDIYWTQLKPVPARGPRHIIDLQFLDIKIMVDSFLDFNGLFSL